MRKLAAFLLLALPLALSLHGSPASAKATAYQRNLQDSQVHLRQILVEFDKSKAGKAVSSVLSKAGVRKVSELQLSYTTYQIVEVPAGQDYMKMLRRLEQNPQVKSVSPNVIKQVTEYTPNDPLFLNGAPSLAEGLTAPYARNNQWGLLQTRAPKAWDITAGDPSIVIALLDTGANFSQEDLVRRFWVNTGEVAGNSVDDDDNGFVDDVNGYDFQTYNLGSQSGGDSDPTDPSGDTVSHGTATASIVAGQGNSGKGVMGVAGGKGLSDGVRLMICRLGTDTNIPVAAEIAAIDYAINNGARVISMSFGGESGGPAEEAAIDRAWDAGVLPIAAAGNIGAGAEDEQGNPVVDLPAGFANCMAVGATTIFSSQRVTTSTNIIAEKRADSYSKTGPELDVVAPGTHIMAAANINNEYTDSVSRQFTGTSAATPVVAGLAGLLLSAKPSLTVQQLRNLIEDTAVDMGPAGHDNEYGHGRIDMFAAMSSIAPTVPGDTNGDGVIDASDLDQISQRFGARTGDANYDAKADANSDGVIDELDVFVVGRQFQ